MINQQPDFLFFVLFLFLFFYESVRNQSTLTAAALLK